MTGKGWLALLSADVRVATDEDLPSASGHQALFYPKLDSGDRQQAQSKADAISEAE
ncbi:hypothetical protein D3C85_1862800 [compost metagenome]